MPASQTYKTHMQLDPLHHFVITPLLLLNLIASFFFWNSDTSQHKHLAFAWIFLSIVLLLMSIKTRVYALKNQDRLIRLEERLRLTALLSSSEHAIIKSLGTRQLIALRFASDEELPILARRAAAEALSPKQIKMAIVNWRPDLERV